MEGCRFADRSRGLNRPTPGDATAGTTRQSDRANEHQDYWKRSSKCYDLSKPLPSLMNQVPQSYKRQAGQRW